MYEWFEMAGTVPVAEVRQPPSMTKILRKSVTFFDSQGISTRGNDECCKTDHLTETSALAHQCPRSGKLRWAQ
ncbi:hypothetical protein TNCV_1715441 [Trichonephila clavipes]|nr:hypothetical protein TNCV_1715441 [Trichonephila clavipes]